MSNDLRFYVVNQKDFEKNSFDVNKFGIKEPKIDNRPADFIDLLIIPDTPAPARPRASPAVHAGLFAVSPTPATVKALE
jgi:nanoRNase/pAp phosphatase (c-di-AMP/oligoRNAs hydrolase)